MGSSPDGAAFDIDQIIRKLSENCRKTPSCENKKPSSLQVSLLHPVRLAEFSVNFFYSVFQITVSFTNVVEHKLCENIFSIK